MDYRTKWVIEQIISCHKDLLWNNHETFIYNYWYISYVDDWLTDQMNYTLEGHCIGKDFTKNLNRLS